MLHAQAELDKHGRRTVDPNRRCAVDGPQDVRLALSDTLPLLNEGPNAQSYISRSSAHRLLERHHEHPVFRCTQPHKSIGVLQVASTMLYAVCVLTSASTCPRPSARCASEQSPTPHTRLPYAGRLGVLWPPSRRTASGQVSKNCCQQNPALSGARVGRLKGLRTAA